LGKKVCRARLLNLGKSVNGGTEIVGVAHERLGRGSWAAVPFWEEFGYTPAVFVRVANAGLTGGKWGWRANFEN